MPCINNATTMTGLAAKRSARIGMTNRPAMLNTEITERNKRRSGKADPLFHGQGDGEDQYDTVPGAPQTVDRRQVPKGAGAAHVLAEHPDTERQHPLGYDQVRRVTGARSVGSSFDVGRAGPEEQAHQNDQAAAAEADEPKGVAPARESQQLGDARRDGRRADASGSLEDAGAETQAASEPSADGGLQGYEGECLGNGQ